MPNFLINVTTKGAKTATRGIKKLTSSLGTLTKVGMVSAGAGAIALGVAMNKATKAAGEQELQEKRLTQALGKNAQALIKQAQALQQSSRFGDEAIIQQQAYLASIGLSEQQIKEMIPVTMDLAAATGMSLESAVKNTAKTLSGMTGELGESVTPLRELTAEELKAGKGIEVMRKMFKGMAENETKTFAGAMDQAKNAMGDAAESLGMLLLPMATQGAKTLSEFSVKVGEAFDFIGKIDFGKTFENMITNMGALQTLIVESFKLAFKVIPDFFRFYVSKILPIMKKVLGFVWGSIKSVAAFLWEPIGIGIQIVIAKVKNFFIGMINFAKKQFNTLAGFANKLGADIQPMEMSKLIDTEGLSMANSKMVQLLKEGSTDSIDTFGELSAAQLELYKQYASEIVELNKKTKEDAPLAPPPEEVEKQSKFFKMMKEGYGGVQKASEKSAISIAQSSAQVGFANINAGKAAEKAAQQAVIAEIQKAVATQIGKIVSTVPFPFNVALAAGGGAAVGSLMQGAVRGFSKFATGANFVTSGPQMMMVGDNPSGQERVQVTPLGGDPNIEGPQGSSVTVNVSGNVMTQDYVEGELAEAIKEGIRRGSDFGVS